MKPPLIYPLLLLGVLVGTILAQFLPYIYQDQAKIESDTQNISYEAYSKTYEFVVGEIISLNLEEKAIIMLVYDQENVPTKEWLIDPKNIWIDPPERFTEKIIDKSYKLKFFVNQKTEITDGERFNHIKWDKNITKRISTIHGSRPSLGEGVEIDVEYEKDTMLATYIFIHG